MAKSAIRPEVKAGPMSRKRKADNALAGTPPAWAVSPRWVESRVRLGRAALVGRGVGRPCACAKVATVAKSKNEVRIA